MEGQWKVSVVKLDNSTDQPTDKRVRFCLYLPHILTGTICIMRESIQVFCEILHRSSMFKLLYIRDFTVKCLNAFYLICQFL